MAPVYPALVLPSRRFAAAVPGLAEALRTSSKRWMNLRDLGHGRGVQAPPSRGVSVGASCVMDTGKIMLEPAATEAQERLTVSMPC